MQPFTEDVIEIIRSIPEGKVCSYGQVAELAGNRKAARQVSRILHSMSSKYNLPWHRVVNSKGMIVIKDPDGAALQRAKLESEGVDISASGKVELEIYRWSGDGFEDY